jgi:pantothenate kinase
MGYAALQICISCSFLKLSIYIDLSKREVNTWAVQRYRQYFQWLRKSPCSALCDRFRF